jgi:hypothetical protein
VHPRQRSLSRELEVIWLDALADAEIDPDTALLYPMEGRATRGQAGCSAHFRPRDFEIRPDETMPELEALLDELNCDDCIEAIRILIWTARTPEGTAALLRHELEHARQVEENGRQLLELKDVVQRVICERIGGLPGGGFLYQATPDELDANAAAAMFVRQRFGTARINQLLQDGDFDSSAFRSLVGPPPLSTLPARMVRFLATVPDLCEKWASRIGGLHFATLLDTRWPGAGALWRRVVEDDPLRRLTRI